MAEVGIKNTELQSMPGLSVEVTKRHGQDSEFHAELGKTKVQAGLVVGEEEETSVASNHILSLFASVS